MKKLTLILLCLPLLFTTCKKEEEHTHPVVKIYGCTYYHAENYNPQANVYVEGICCYTSNCERGCTDQTALNYNFQATTNDGSCLYTPSASWDCIQDVCFDPGTGNGQYSSESACNADCGSAISITGDWVVDDYILDGTSLFSSSLPLYLTSMHVNLDANGTSFSVAYYSDGTSLNVDGEWSLIGTSILRLTADGDTVDWTITKLTSSECDLYASDVGGMGPGTIELSR